MTPETLEQFRLKILRILSACDPFHLQEMEIHLRAGDEGYRVERIEVQRALAYLEEAGFASKQAKLISPEVKMWKITKAGTDFLAQL